MHLGLPEIVKLVKESKTLALSPVPAEAQAKAMSNEELLGTFLMLLGRFAAQGRLTDQEYQFTVEQASKKGITEEDITILKFVMGILTLPPKG